MEERLGWAWERALVVSVLLGDLLGKQKWTHLACTASGCNGEVDNSSSSSSRSRSSSDEKRGSDARTGSCAVLHMREFMAITRILAQVELNL